MAVLPIRIFPDPVLRQKAMPVEEITPAIQQLIDDMAETMYAAPGVGLAANQVGVLHRVFVIDTAAEDEPSDLRVFINPEIALKDGELTWKEGCLSFPGITESVERAARVVVRALDRDGKPFEMEAEGLMAVAIQHESEHLDGALMLDRLGPVRRRLVQRKLQKRGASAAAV
jgi:peptide deformylase